MRLDVRKIDERIEKLQELRRIAMDAEMTQLLSEFALSENGASSAPGATATAGLAPTAMAPEVGDGVSDLVKAVLDGKEALPRGIAGAGWSNRKG